MDRKRSPRGARKEPTVVSAPPDYRRRIGGSPIVRSVLAVVLVALVAAIASSLLRQPRSQELPDATPAKATMVASNEPGLSVVPGAEIVEVPAGMKAKYSKWSPSDDDWDTEVLNEVAGAQLKQIAKLLAHPEKIDVDAASKLARADFASPPLRPTDLVEVHRDDTLSVREAKSPVSDRAARFHGPAGLAMALSELARPFLRADDYRAKFKIIRVDGVASSFETLAYFQASGRTAEGRLQQNATWRIRWSIPVPDSPPLLTSATVERHVEVTTQMDGATFFADCTESVLGANASFRDQLLPSLDHWRARLDEKLDSWVWGHHGLAVGDVNGDGLDDLFLCQNGGIPNKLFVQNPDGTATDVSAAAGVDHLDISSSALILDLDNDGDQDLVVTVGESLLVLSNDGRGRFTPVFSFNRSAWSSLSAADFDGDGDLDLYACRYTHPAITGPAPVPYHDANHGPANVFLRNDGGWVFTDITHESGLDSNNRRFSFAASWEDYDNDGDPDLYVANDFGRNNLYRNDDGHFVDVAAEAGVEDVAAGMGVSWADYNRDGLMDLYVSNMFSSAGNRVAYQRRFKADSDPTTVSLYRRHARGNSLFENTGDGTFRDVSVEAGVTMGRWAWGNAFLDFNNDGWQDIFVTNGFVTNDDTKDL